MMTFTCVVFVMVMCSLERIAGQGCESLTYKDVIDTWVKLTPSVDKIIGNEIDLTKSSKSVQIMFDKSFSVGDKQFLWSRYVGDDYHMASLACAYYGGQLPEIKNEEELLAIRSFVQKNAYTHCAYIGMTKLADSKWYYLRSKTPAYTKFGPNVLVNDPFYSCGILWRDGDWFMDDAPCKEQCHVMCEMTN